LSSVNSKRGHAPALDILRASAALLVMLVHLRDQYFATYSQTACASRVFRAAFFTVTRLGLEAVIVFFALVLCLLARTPFGWGNFAVNLFSLQRVFGDPFPLSGRCGR
jgi:peptidoglycan/LPS O-acetylase OafA/YrhL